ncbi:rhodanese-like domain-containing protein [Planctomicrobium sp. SH668]|uniref:rhodanese-like domain-containing protein n=1 Tax=Planctomicrobium sp. SH668 TaxID=3448126 RepID=UPI003F5B2DF5
MSGVLVADVTESGITIWADGGPQLIHTSGTKAHNMADTPLPLELDCESVQQLQESGEKFIFIDCREQNEFDIAKIPGATLLPMSELQDRVGELDGSQTERIVVHCHHGGRSLRVANWLRNQGFSNAQSMAGGIDAWALRLDPNIARY